ncbi:hypothetical protein ACT80S_00850 [Ramlibacter sp. MAHUQ-53]|uniref:hypothetical protein n=1 Tax=unclassified Ramlibacter TaxID=2617605 RepID=UPI003636E43D
MATATPPAVDLAAESVAGEEDPGAAIELPAAPMAPGDQAPAGTPGTGEGVCPRCGGSGRIGETECPDCLGTGRIIEGIGGG